MAISAQPQTSLSKEERMRLALLAPDCITAERLRRDFFAFMQEFWPVIVSDEPQWNWHIPYICEQLQGAAEAVAAGQPAEDLVINVPPGTTKTTICSIMFPVWCWTRWPWMRFITASYNSGLALESAEYSRDLVRSERFAQLFPAIRIKQDKDTKSNFRLQYLENGVWQSGGSRYSTSVGGTVTGFHGHFIIVDDPLDPEGAASEREVETCNRFMDQTIPTRKIDKAVTRMVLIQQRLHQNDATGHLRNKNKKNLRHICLPGEIQNYREQVQPPELVERYENDLLDPVRMSWDILRNMKVDLGQYGFAGQVGQRPTPPGGGMFQPDHLRVITALRPAQVVRSVRYWDKAGTDRGGAYTVGVLMHLMQDGKYVISDIVRGQWASGERERIIRETAEADGKDVVQWFEQEPGSGGKESAEATTRSLAGFSVHSDRVTGSKVSRADTFSVQVNDGNVQLVQGPWNQEFTEELRFFPYSTYKDQVDASSGSFTKLTGKRRAGPLRQRA